jgi:protein-S-isoprenylcysteine O-methyltransferase Ste14
LIPVTFRATAENKIQQSAAAAGNPAADCIRKTQIHKEVEMKRFQEFLYGLHPYMLSSVASVLTVAQIALAFFLNRDASEAVQWVGWICLWTAGLFGVIPTITFRRKGGVPRGESYIATTKLVDTGIYAIVRHPQGGTSWLLINLGVMLIAYHWTSVVLGLVSISLVYADTFKTDQSCIEKFGEEYRQYIQRVPRVNFIFGIIRLVLSSKKSFGK